MPNPSMVAAMMEEDEYLASLEGGGDTKKAFWYLAGPMTGIPGFNFPEFHRVAGVLRNAGYNVVNPAQLDEEIARKTAEESPDGASTHEKWAECLRRDIELVSSPNCQGVILLDGWESSGGAQFETYVAMKLRLPLMKFSEAQDRVVLDKITRRVALESAGIVDA